MSPLLEPDTTPPDLPADPSVAWLNGPPLTLSDLRGRVALVHFWDHTALGCLHALGYIRAWHDRYAAAGLTIVAVHTPEFEFAAELANLRAAVGRLALRMPVVHDPAYVVWRTFANPCWPTWYIVDAQGRLRFYHLGEGQYQSMEMVLQALLLERDDGFAPPPPLEPLRPEDRPRAARWRVTPEVQFGLWERDLGNAGGLVPDRPHAYRPHGDREAGRFYLDGVWIARQQYIEAGAPGARLELPFEGGSANLVAHPGTAADAPVRLRVRFQGQDVPPAWRGADLVTLEDGSSGVGLADGRLHELLDFRGERGRGALALEAPPGARLYAATFGSGVD